MMKKVNNILIIISIVISIIYLILSNNYILNQILLCIAVIPVIFVPKIVRHFWHIKISSGLELVYIIFIDMALVFGSLMGGYGLISWYDSFTHFLSGMFTFVIGLSLLVWSHQYNLKNRAFNLVFTIMFTLSIAVLWECVEFTIDFVLKTDTQKVMDTGVTDTMKDMICALLGSVVLSISYIWAFSNSDDNFWSKLIKSSM